MRRNLTAIVAGIMGMVAVGCNIQQKTDYNFNGKIGEEYIEFTAESNFALVLATRGGASQLIY